ncbi:cytochrome b/b6 domain-containing protein [Microbacterium maritypicum]|uniref:Cytochrome b/b6 domain-containing protein n=1 Tax=Microbacterium maritypicum TaxID=33918 RepID=A0ACD4B590_MICMQ|nr:cytochrome b/b6 domain-containing protein [Microbacterium liquefaciens]UTT52548.1 cytochrome b/b6 domain-containing protein [Microbacterium liquefaciens]
MATRMLRRGLPRVPGGEPWPPADAVAVDAAAAEPEAGAAPEPVAHAVTPAAVAPAPPTDAVSPATSGALRIRRGLPRVSGGEPWPPSQTAPAPAAAAPAPHATTEEPAAEEPAAEEPAAEAASPVSTTATTPQPAAASTAPSAVAESEAPPVAAADVRRGLPRVVGGDPWPPADTVPRVRTAAGSAPLEPVASESTPAATVETPAAAATAVAVAGSAPAIADVSTPLPWTRTVWNGHAPRHILAAPAPATDRRRPTWTQAIGVLFGAAALGVLAGAAIAFVRTLLSFPFMQDFLAAFPGEYEPAIAVEPGFSPWIGWQHFFNMFLMVLIIRSGLQVRTEKRPTVFWTPRGNPKGKISLNLWFHQSLDILWLVNGVIFVVLLFVTGHWVRIVPTSWEVFPNALSAALQYVSFDWPHENGWNNYNSLQQLAYFATVFIAAPLAAITGFRMSGLWPKKAEKLSKAYPVEWARALHFPIMLYFVAFIIAHVALVMLTGFLRNLNHMFAAQDAVTWTGFWVFVLSLVVIAIAWVAARPLVLAPIAKAFGKVSGR